MAQDLSTGCIGAALGGAPVLNVYLQVLDIKMINSTSPRFRMTLNDGLHQTSVMAATQLTEYMASGAVKAGSIILVNELISNVVQGKRILIALQVNLVGFHDGPIGTPVPLTAAAVPTEQDQNAPPPPAPHAAPPSHNQQLPPQAAGKSYAQDGKPYQATVKQEGAPGAVNGGGGHYNGGGGAPYQQQPPPPQQQQHPPPHIGGNVGGGGYHAPPAGGLGGGPLPGSFAGNNNTNQNGGGGVIGGGGYPQSSPGRAYHPPPGGVGGFGAGGHVSNVPPPAAGPTGYGGMPAGGNGGGGGGGYGGMGGHPGGGGGGGSSGPSTWASQTARYGAGGGAIARNEAPLRIQPIASLNPYISKWAVKARCTAKTDLRRFNGMKGEGRLFSFDLLDKEGGEIRVTAFGEQADKYFGPVEVGRIYMVSKASLVHKKPQFNSTNHDFEVRLERDSIVEEVVGDVESANIPSVQYNFRTLSDVSQMPNNSTVDVMAVVESVDQWQTLIKKNGEETQKRALVIRDNTNRSIELTLWGTMAMSGVGEALENRVRQGEHPILAIKGARVGDFSGKSLSTLNSSIVNIDPDHPHAAVMRQWYDSQGVRAPAEPLSVRGAGGGRVDRRCTIAGIRDEQLGKSGKPDWVAVSGTIAFIRRGDTAVSYPGCPKEFSGRTCQKKLVEQSQGQWYCERCNAYSMPSWRYMVQMQAADHTGAQWVTAFGDAGESIFRMTAEELKVLENDDPGRHEEVMKAAQHTERIFKLKVAEESYQDEMKIKVSIAKVDDIDFIKESAVLLDYIHKLEAGQPIMVAAPPNGPPQALGGGGGPGYPGAGPSSYAPQQRAGAYSNGAAPTGMGAPGPVAAAAPYSTSPVGGQRGPPQQQGAFPPYAGANGPPLTQQQQYGGMPGQQYAAAPPQYGQAAPPPQPQHYGAAQAQYGGQQPSQYKGAAPVQAQQYRPPAQQYAAPPPQQQPGNIGGSGRPYY